MIIIWLIGRNYHQSIWSNRLRHFPKAGEGGGVLAFPSVHQRVGTWSTFIPWTMDWKTVFVWTSCTMASDLAISRHCQASLGSFSRAEGQTGAWHRANVPAKPVKSNGNQFKLLGFLDRRKYHHPHPKTQNYSLPKSLSIFIYLFLNVQITAAVQTPRVEAALEARSCQFLKSGCSFTSQGCCWLRLCP